MRRLLAFARRHLGPECHRALLLAGLAWLAQGSSLQGWAFTWLDSGLLLGLGWIRLGFGWIWLSFGFPSLGFWLDLGWIWLDFGSLWLILVHSGLAGRLTYASRLL